MSSEPPADEGWLPYDTAPEEGTFLVWLTEAEMCGHVYPMKRRKNVSLIGHRFVFDINNPPTHWRPTLESPTAS